MLSPCVGLFIGIHTGVLMQGICVCVCVVTVGVGSSLGVGVAVSGILCLGAGASKLLCIW